MKSVSETMARVNPSLRAAIARKLVEDYGKSQTEIAHLLGITQAAVSQYLKNIRGHSKIVDNPVTKDEIKIFCEHVVNDKADPTSEFHNLGYSLRSKRIVCGACEVDRNFCNTCVSTKIV